MSLRLAGLAILLAIVSDASAGGGEILFVNGFDGTVSVPRFVPVDKQVGAAERLLVVDIDTSEPANQIGILFSLVDAPSGMSIDAASGEIRWIPTRAQTGLDSVTVRAENPEGLSNTLSFNVEIVDPSAAPLIAAIPDQTIEVGDSFHYTVQASDPDPGDVLSFELVAPPPGLLIDPVTGELTWTPQLSDIGSYAIRVRVADLSGATSERLFQLDVININQPPVIDVLPDRGAVPAVLFSIQANAVDPDGGAVTFSLSIRPTGMVIDPDSGRIDWTPTVQQLGLHAVTVVATDSVGARAETSFEVFVDMNRAPVAFDDGVFEIERDDILVMPAPGVLGNDVDPNGDPLTAQLVGGPSKGSLTLNEDGSFEYIPSDPPGAVGFAEALEFIPPVGFPLAPPLIADVNDDGRTDVVSQIGNGVAGLNRFIVSSPDTGELISTSPQLDRGVVNGTGKALADIDLDGYVEIISVGGENNVGVPNTVKIFAFEHDGTFKWESEQLAERYVIDGLLLPGDGTLDTAEPTIADLDQDGTPEIIVGHGLGAANPALSGVAVTAFDNQGMKLFTSHARGLAINSGGSFMRVEVVDLDLDGDPELLVGPAAFSHTGELLWVVDGLDNFTRRSTPLAANLDNDPFPELVRSGTDALKTMALNHDGSILWQADTAFNFPPGEAELVVADVDDDGAVEVLAVSNNSEGKLEVLNGIDGSLKWEYPTDGTLLNVGIVSPTVFDLDGDGNTEVLLFGRNPRRLLVLEGETGTLRQEFDLGLSNASYTETPIFADVDADGASELLLNGTFRFSPAPSSAYWVFESPNDDWAPTRAVWNQWNYHVTNVNEDGTIPQFEQPHWLLPGLNKNRVNSPLPEDRLIEQDQFSYRASDGELQSNVATVDITILPPNTPPRIVSTPRTLASPGFQYVYRALALDADIGDTLSWSIGDGPAGMTVDAQGTVRWTPSVADVGENSVVLQVSDQLGLVGYQFFSITIQEPNTVPGLAGLTEAQAIATVAAAGFIVDPLLRAFSDAVPQGRVISQTPLAGSLLAAGGSIEVVISRGPTPLPVPDLITQTLENATSDLLLAGFSVGAVVFVNDVLQPANTVMVQDPAPQARAVPGTPVDLTVSGGPRAVIDIVPNIIPAGQAAVVTVTVRDIDGTPLDPQPAISLALEVPAGDLTGPPPVLNGNTIMTSADSQGRIGVVASFSVSGAEQFTARAIITQAISDGDGANVFGEFVAQLATFDRLIGELITAVNVNDVPAILALDAALGDLLEAVDLPRLGSLSPIAPAGGVPPSPATLAQNGFPPGMDDAAYREAALDLFVVLEQTEQIVAGGTAPDPVVNALNQELSEVASVIATLEPDVYGVIDSAEVLISVLGIRAPRLLVADIEAVRRELRDAGIITADGGVAAGRFTLAGIMSATRIRNRIIKDVYVPYLGDVARSLGTVIAADLLQDFANDGEIVGVITGASQSFQVFDVDNSVIEGFGFDTLLPEGNSVTIVGPELINAVLAIVSQDLPQAQDLKDLNDIRDAIQAEIDLANNLVTAFDAANSSPAEALRGCVLDNRPNCRQLVYPEGFKSVYKVNGGLSLPAPVVFIVHNLAGGGFAVFVANFVPTREED